MKKPMDIYRAERIFRILFFGGFMSLVFSLMMERIEATFLTYLLGVLGIISFVGGLIFGLLMIRCPDCGKTLVVGRTPGIPKFCPHCGKQLKEDA